MISILLVDNSAIVRKGLVRLLNDEPNLLVVAEADNGITALTLVENGLQPDIIISDLNMPRMNGFELIFRLKEIACPSPVIILTMHLHASFRDKALTIGAKGYLLKGENEAELFAGIRAVYAGDIFVSAGFSN